MQAWEYKIISLEKEFYSTKVEKKVENILNDFGREGWELIGYVSFQTYFLAFKRPLETVISSLPTE